LFVHISLSYRLSLATTDRHPVIFGRLYVLGPLLTIG